MKSTEEFEKPLNCSLKVYKISKWRERKCVVSKFFKIFKKNPPISGHLKLQPFDFHVNEIFQKKNIHLTNIPFFDDSHENKIEKITLNQKLTHLENVLKKYSDFLPHEELKFFFSSSKKDQQVFTLPFHVKEKEDRKKIHEILCESFPNFSCRFVSSKNEQKKFQFFYDENAKKWRDLKKKKMMEKRYGKYLQFVLYKYNVGTKPALSLIFDFFRKELPLHGNKPVFTFCGMKDKKASTSQLVRVCNVNKVDLYAFNRYRKDIEKKDDSCIVRLGNFEQKKVCLNFGMAEGNCFRIVIRDVVSSNSGAIEKKMDLDEMENLLRKVNENGFINYFGLQRFGAEEMGNYHYGIEMLKNNWMEVVRLYLTRKKKDKVIHEELVDFWKVRNYEKTLKLLENNLDYYEEIKMIKFLFLNQSKLLNSSTKEVQLIYNQCFEKCVPSFLRSFFVHSYSSYIWNQIVSTRLKKGFTPIVGDIVMVNNKKYKLIKTKEELKGVSITDIVLPLISSDISFPQSDVVNKKTFENLLRKDSLSLDSFKLKKEYVSSSKVFRKIVIKPGKFRWKFLEYLSNDKALIITDLQKIKRKSKRDECLNIDNVKEKRLALKISFTLPSGSYATMLIREILNIQNNVE